MRKLIAAMAVAMALLGLTQPSTAEPEVADAPKRAGEFKGEIPEADFQNAPGSFEDKVEDAVDKGCDWLKKQQNPEGHFGKLPPNPPTYGAGEPHKYEVGRTAFPLWALCKSGVFPDEPEILKALQWLEKNFNDEKAQQAVTYENACVVNAIEAYYIGIWEVADRKLTPAKRKKEGIKRWGTEEKGAKKAKHEKKDRKLNVDPKHRKLAERAVKALDNAFQRAYGTGGWRYRNPTTDPGPKNDISATQYALLGYGAASRLGIGYKKENLFEAYKFFIAEQDKDGPKLVREAAPDEEKPEDKKGDDKKKDPNKGTEVRKYNPKKTDRARGWGYCRKDVHMQGDELSYGSMTCAGICGLVVLRGELEDDPKFMAKWKPLAAECDQALSDGLAWMVLNWSVENNPQRGKYRYYYYLYALERLAMFGGLDYIGKHDWYFEGAQVLLREQDGSGMWDTNQEVDPSDVYDTCYALLFLKRATDGIKRPVPVFTGEDQED